ncbi:helix-turn-helix domain-containing protein [Aliivibrio finisterrensis]|jgi:transcriptional regulator with XRE-family HTH domain
MKRYYNIVTIVTVGFYMLSLHTAFDVQLELKDFIKQRRKQQKLSVEVLAKCSGVPYSTIRKFENTGNISLRQFLMLLESVGSLNDIHNLTKPSNQEPTSIEEVLRNA